MAKLKKATPADFSAMLSNSVTVRKYRNQIVFSAVTTPKESKSEKKKETNDRFRYANKYAKEILKQPGMKELYSKGINDKKSNAHTVAVSDYMNAPVIHYIRTKDYSGAIGDKLRIKVTDDFQVTEVNVSILSKEGVILERGAAVRYGRKPAIWIYTTTVSNSHLEGTLFRVLAKDLPANRVTQEVRIETTE